MIRTLLISALSALVMASTAHAQAATDATVVSPSAAAASTIIGTSLLFAESGTSYYACSTVNMSKSAALVTLQIISDNGVVYSTAANITIPGGGSYFTFARYQTGYARCQITVKGSASYLRANMAVFYFNGTYTDVIEFSEAR